MGLSFVLRLNCKRTIKLKKSTLKDKLIFIKENDSKRARALKKAAEEREMRRAKDREIARSVILR